MRLCPTDHQSTTLFVKERDYSSGEDCYDLDSLCLKMNPLKLNIQPLYTRFHKKKQRSLIHVYDISHAKILYNISGLQRRTQEKIITICVKRWKDDIHGLFQVQLANEVTEIVSCSKVL